MTRPTHMDAEGNPCFPQGVEGATLLPDDFWEARDFEAARGKKLAALSAEFKRQLALGCASPKGAIACDDQAQQRIAFVISSAQLAQAIGQPVPPSVNWTMLDRSQVAHSLADLIAAQLSIGLGFQAKMAVRQAKEAALRSAADLAALDEIDVTGGWP